MATGWRKAAGWLAAGGTPAVPADARGKRIGILVVAYNALTTLSATLKRIPPEVWANIEEVAVFDDASKDETYELAVGYKAVFGREKLTIFKNAQNLRDALAVRRSCGHWR